MLLVHIVFVMMTGDICILLVFPENTAYIFCLLWMSDVNQGCLERQDSTNHILFSICCNNTLMSTRLFVGV